MLHFVSTAVAIDLDWEEIQGNRRCRKFGSKLLFVKLWNSEIHCLTHICSTFVSHIVH
jgi:hypothetical protein